MPDARPDGRSVLGKAMQILQAFGAEDRRVGLSELTRRTGLPKATVHRIAQDLSWKQRLLAATDRGYRLGRGLFESGMMAAPERSLIEVAVPFMQDLFLRTRETVHLGVLEGDEVVYLSKIGGHGQPVTPTRVLGRTPLFCMATGKALLAYPPQHTIDSELASPLERRTSQTVMYRASFGGNWMKLSNRESPTSMRNPCRESPGSPPRAWTPTTDRSQPSRFHRLDSGPRPIWPLCGPPCPERRRSSPAAA